ncbi:beta-glucosidase 40-like [Gossypium australe]|uniref:Beta-glucosidase 40-like n=1 Tax=Gossypium australe TaxID=47621 RepID=A0A5B6X381_9ROSI|nr:beta-glucosidase 40-like [Gossypium australe]
MLSTNICHSTPCINGVGDSMAGTHAQPTFFYKYPLSTPRHERRTNNRLILNPIRPIITFLLALGFQAGFSQNISRASSLEGFVLGASSSAFQAYEGAVREDGRGPTIWDAFLHTSDIGNIADDSNADVAVDHYHRYTVSDDHHNCSYSDIRFLHRILLFSIVFHIPKTRMTRD